MSHGLNNWIKKQKEFFNENGISLQSHKFFVYRAKLAKKQFEQENLPKLNKVEQLIWKFQNSPFLRGFIVLILGISILATAKTNHEDSIFFVSRLIIISISLFMPMLRTKKIKALNKESNERLVWAYTKLKSLRVDQQKNDFLNSPEWRRLRREFILAEQEKVKPQPLTCENCKKVLTSKNLNVDHIKPRSKFPDYSLRIDNLALLCRRCNLTKSDHYEVKKAA